MNIYRKLYKNSLRSFEFSSKNQFIEKQNKIITEDYFNEKFFPT